MKPFFEMLPVEASIVKELGSTYWNVIPGPMPLLWLHFAVTDYESELILAIEN
jgi:hypothetical protein